MPDFGVGRALRKGIKKSRATRPVEALEEPKPVADPSVAPETPDVLAPTAPPVTDEPAKPIVTREAPIKEAPVTIDDEARRISRANLKDFDLDEIHQTNFDTIRTTDDIKAVIAETAERNKGRIDEARRGKITNDQLRALAGELNVKEDVVQQVLERQTGQTLSPELILASRQVLNSSADRVRSLAVKINSGQATDIERLQFRRQMQFHDEYQTAFMGARAETGRALNAFGIPVGLENSPKQLAALKQTVDGMFGRDTDDLARMVANIDTVEGLNKFTKDYTRSKLAGTLQELYINSILSGPKTQLVNTIGNALFQTMNVAEVAVAARMGKLLPGSSHVQVGEAQAMAYGAITGWRDALRLAAKSFKQGGSLDSVAKFEGHTRRAISAQNYGIADPTLGAAVDALGAFIRLPTERLMAPTDEAFKALAYRSDLARTAYRNAMEQARLQNLGADDTARLITEFMDNPPPAAIQQADDFARYVTFQAPLGQIGADLQRGIQNFPGGFIVAPFIKTPVNIFKAGLLERSPLAVFSKQFRETLQHGGPERDLAVARVAMGTLTVASVAVAAGSGFVTGGGPQNPDARKALLASGWQPYSIRVTDGDGNVTYHSYARAEPWAYVVGATADAVEILSAIGTDGDDLRAEEEQVNHMIAAIAAGVANNTMSKTFLSGVADFTEAMTDPERYMMSYLERLGSSILPYSAFRRQAAQLQDPLFREAWTFSERLRAESGIPGWSELSPPRRDIFGEPIKRPTGAVFGAASPFPDTEEKIDPTLREVIRVMQETGTVPVAMPAKRVDGMKLTAKEYDELVRIGRTEPILGGRTFMEALDDLYSSPVYLDATPDLKVSLMKRVQQQADQVARAVMERDNPEFAERLNTHRYKKRSLLYGPERAGDLPMSLAP